MLENKLDPLSNIDEKKERTLYIRLPHSIRDRKDVEKLCVGNFQVKLRRQLSRECYVIFSTVEDKLKNIKILSDKSIDGKRIIVNPLQATRNTEKKPKKPKLKKVVVPSIKKAEIIKTRSVHISNIKPGTKRDEIKQVLQGCISITFLKASKSQNTRAALAKFEDPYIANEYLKRQRTWPCVNGNHIKIHPDTRNKKKKKRRSSKSTLKIYDGSVSSDENNTGENITTSKKDVQNIE